MAKIHLGLQPKIICIAALTERLAGKIGTQSKVCLRLVSE
jgi:hypothetical protein